MPNQETEMNELESQESAENAANDAVASETGTVPEGARLKPLEV